MWCQKRQCFCYQNQSFIISVNPVRLSIISPFAVVVTLTLA